MGTGFGASTFEASTTGMRVGGGLGLDSSHAAKARAAQQIPSSFFMAVVSFVLGVSQLPEDA